MELDQAWLTACQATWKRWLSGDRIPRSDAGAVLEFMLGVGVETLLRPAVECGVVLPQIAPSAARDAARLLNSMFDTSYLDPLGRASGMEGVWHLDGQRFFDGTSVAVQLYEADEQDGRVVIGAHHHAHVRAFTRATRRALQERLADGGAAPERVFCIPATDAGASQRYERILLWPAVAMMERDGQKISVCAEPEYKRIDGFVLAPGRRVISANWLGSEGIWYVDTTDSLADVSAYAQVRRPRPQPERHQGRQLGGAAAVARPPSRPRLGLAGAALPRTGRVRHRGDAAPAQPPHLRRGTRTSTAVRG
ncbi:hypothetical protein ACFRNJ_43810 [Streptomyces sp. NPDC056721]|uniref:hypothetical protein n=1 Tax=Streptomyces sp. NPDC056721 TaxID=3345923 RepID=UPI0036CA502D